MGSMYAPETKALTTVNSNILTFATADKLVKFISNR